MTSGKQGYSNRLSEHYGHRMFDLSLDRMEWRAEVAEKFRTPGYGLLGLVAAAASPHGVLHTYKIGSDISQNLY